MWKKFGIVFSANRAQLPTFTELFGKQVVTFSKRDERGRSVGHIVSYKLTNEGIIFDETSEKIIEPGAVGTPDHAGVMPMQIFDDKMFYIGWTLRKDVPYFNYSSVAVWKEDKFKKLGPILPPNYVDPGYSGTLCVFQSKSDKLYLGAYLSSVDWVNDETNQLQPCYDLKLAKSQDLLNWTKTGNALISLENDEAGISSASVLQHNDRYHTWFSVRGSRGFRQYSKSSYKILHAYSEDGERWTRSGELGLKPSCELGENMAAYPSVIKEKDKLHLIYNGTDFGVDGISYATLDVEFLNSVV
jgi:hypothetical protein